MHLPLYVGDERFPTWPTPVGQACPTRRGGELPTLSVQSRVCGIKKDKRFKHLPLYVGDERFPVRQLQLGGELLPLSVQSYYFKMK